MLENTATQEPQFAPPTPHRIQQVLTGKIHLTPREKECAYYLLRGMTAKQIGRTINKSHRTIECYIVNLKTKFDCNSKYELVNKIWDMVF